MPTLEELVTAWHADQPHPRAPGLRVGEYPVAMRLATILKFGQGHSSPSEAANFWHEFTTMNRNLEAQNKQPISPEEFTHLAQQAGRSSFAFHGRPPSMYELQRLRDADPKAVHDYYGGLPDEHYPTISAADMAKSLHAARPWANQIVGREPVKLEAAYLHSSGQNPADYYQQVSRGSNDQGGPQSGVASPGDAGGQPPDPRGNDPRLAPGPGAPGGPPGVPAR
jgi:hypothetical protein